MTRRRVARAAASLVAPCLVALTLAVSPASAQSPPAGQRGTHFSERSGQHDANNIRTIFWNYGMVGDYPRDPLGVDLSVFHSAEVPKGTGMNYSDGITPFVLAKVHTADGQDVYIMETGFRERQGESPRNSRTMRFEPRPGYFQENPGINVARSPAISNDPRTWPPTWPDKDASWNGSWNGYFGKRPAADQESFTVMDDEYYDAWAFYPDSADSSRHGLGLRVEVRGFQWANPQAGNVIFWHYDITNEGTVDYIDNIIFGLYMDSGVGGSAISCDGIAESDDDNAFWDRSYALSGSRLNLVYTWDRYGHGVALGGPCEPTGYLGYAYMETPGNPFDGLDNDDDGIRDEKRDGGPGNEVVGQPQILATLASMVDTIKFVRQYGPIANMPAYKAGRWWTGDEDMDWEPEFSDVGADGVAETGDAGEGDGRPTEGEPNFDRTDLNESDQIGLTGFKLNRIKRGAGNPDPDSAVDGIVFFTNNDNWPEKLFTKFAGPLSGRFDLAEANNYNLGFLFASGPFRMMSGQTERFSLALAYGADLVDLRNTVGTVQQIYNANYQFAVPPTPPTVTAEAGDGRVRLSWDDAAERSVDPVTHDVDFEGYRIYRSTDPDFRDVEVVTTARGNDIGLRKPNVQIDKNNGIRGSSRKTVEGVAYYLGDDTGITHVWTDDRVTNGQEYFYAVTAYDRGFETVPYADSSAVFPSENPLAAITRTLRGGYILPTNIVRVRPNTRVKGWTPPTASAPEHVQGSGVGTVEMQIVNQDIVPENHVFHVTFDTSSPDSIRASSYSLIDSTTGVTLFTTGRDLLGAGTGPTASGLLPVVTTIANTTLDSTRTGWAPGGSMTVPLDVAYQSVVDPNLERTGYPDSIDVVFDDVVADTSRAFQLDPARPVKFRVVARTAQGDVPLDFRFRECCNSGCSTCNVAGVPPDSTLSRISELIDIITGPDVSPGVPNITWRVRFLTTPAQRPRRGDVFRIRVRTPLRSDDVFRFVTKSARVNGALADAQAGEEPYVVPNPYVEAASFEPSRYAVSGRGDRRIEFRNLAQGSTVRIYTLRGDLVQTLQQDGSLAGYVAWDLRTKDNLDVAPGLYLYHVEAPNMPKHSGKFAIIK